MLQEADPGNYLFSVGFKPGNRRIGVDNVDKRWRKYVKADPPEPGTERPFDKRKWSKREYVPLGIKKDFYPLKHRNLDKIAEQQSLQHAKDAAGHTNIRTTEKYYTVGEEKRKLERLKKVKIDFT